MIYRSRRAALLDCRLPSSIRRRVSASSGLAAGPDGGIGSSPHGTGRIANSLFADHRSRAPLRYRRAPAAINRNNRAF